MRYEIEPELYDPRIAEEQYDDMLDIWGDSYEDDPTGDELIDEDFEDFIELMNDSKGWY